MPSQGKIGIKNIARFVEMELVLWLFSEFLEIIISLVQVSTRMTRPRRRPSASLSSAAVIKTDTAYEFTLLDGQAFYFRPNVSQTCRILITVNGDFRWSIYRVRGNTIEYAKQNGSPYVDFRAGDTYYVETDPVPTGTAMAIQIILLPN